MNAQDILRKSAQHIDDRAAARDPAQGGRSMARAVAAFNALTGHQLSERDGWLFMVQLKAARATNTPTGIADDYEDMAAYSALAGESVAVNDNAQRKPGELLNIVNIVGNEVEIPRGHYWIAQHPSGMWYSYRERPQSCLLGWMPQIGARALFGSPPKRDWKFTLRQVSA